MTMTRDARLGRTALMREAARQLGWPSDQAKWTRDQRRMIRRVADDALRTQRLRTLGLARTG